MGRILFWVILGFVFWLLWRGAFRAPRPREGDRAPAQTPRGEDMVVCARCGVHLPRSEAREEQGRLVCRDNPRCVAPQ